jgi:hypothetical protein
MKFQARVCFLGFKDSIQNSGINSLEDVSFILHFKQ